MNLTDARALAESARENTSAGLEAREQLPDLVDQLAAVVETAYACKIVQRSVRPLVDKAVHTPARLRAYLLTNGWKCERQHERSSDWRHEEGGLVAHVLIDDEAYEAVERAAEALREDIAAGNIAKGAHSHWVPRNPLEAPVEAELRAHREQVLRELEHAEWTRR